MNPDQPKPREPGEGQDPELRKVQAMFAQVSAQIEKDIAEITQAELEGRLTPRLWALQKLWHLPFPTLFPEDRLNGVARSRVEEFLTKKILSPASAAHLMSLLDVSSPEDRGYNTVCVNRFLHQWKETQACQKQFVMEEMLKQIRELIWEEFKRRQEKKVFPYVVDPLIKNIETLKQGRDISEEVADLLLAKLQGPLEDDRKFMEENSLSSREEESIRKETIDEAVKRIIDRKYPPSKADDQQD